MDSAYVVVMTVYRPNIQGLSALCVVDTIARCKDIDVCMYFNICYRYGGIRGN